MFYIEKYHKIVLFDTDMKRLENTLLFTPQYKDLPIQETEEGYTIVDYQLVTVEEAEEIARQKEQQRIDALSLTPSDVERALYKAKNMDFEDLKALIAEQAPQLDMKALAIEFRANNFYRGVVVNGIRLIDTVGALLGYTSADMDYLFEHKELPKKEIENGNNEIL